MYFLGVDVGGTKTDFLLVNEHGEVLSFLRTDGANYQGVGVEKSIKILQEGLQKILAGCNLRNDDLNYAFFGFAGADSEYEIQIVRNILKQLKLRNYDFDNDGRIALKSGTIDDVGIMISCGTGGINFASDGQRVERIGGFSRFFGERLGSYIIAGQVASAIVRAKDGRDEQTLMSKIFETKIGMPIENIMHYEYEEDGFENFRYYAVELIKTLFEAANQFDCVALRILDEIVEEVLKIVAVFKKKLTLPVPTKLVLEGSFFKNSDPILFRMIETALGKDYNIIVPKHPPVLGAVLFAYEKSGLKPDQRLIDQLLNRLEGIV